MNTNMKLTFLLFFLILPTWALSLKLDNWTFSELSPIEVRLVDSATGGCWTNIGEVQTYIEDKLEMSGADLIQIKGELLSSEVRLGKATVFLVHVIAERNPIGFCVGSLEPRKKDSCFGPRPSHVRRCSTELSWEPPSGRL